MHVCHIILHTAGMAGGIIQLAYRMLYRCACMKEGTMFFIHRDSNVLHDDLLCPQRNPGWRGAYSRHISFTAALRYVYVRHAQAQYEQL